MLFTTSYQHQYNTNKIFKARIHPVGFSSSLHCTQQLPLYLSIFSVTNNTLLTNSFIRLQVDTTLFSGHQKVMTQEYELKKKIKHNLAISAFHIKNNLHGALGPISTVKDARFYWSCSIHYV